MMIDTVKLQFQCKHSGFGDRIVRTTKYEQEIRFRAKNMIPYRGAKLRVTSIQHGEKIEVEGSAAKFLQGFNAFGSLDLQELSLAIFKTVTRKLGIKPSAEEVQRVRSGDVRIMKLDITGYVDCGSREAVPHVLKALHVFLAGRGKRVVGYKDETVVWGEGSKYWMMKFYDKAKEMKVHRPRKTHPDDVHELHKRLRGEVRGLIRAELSLRARELNGGWHRVSDWDERQCEYVFREYLSKLCIRDARYFSPTKGHGDLSSATPHHKALVILSRTGFDLRTLYPGGAFKIQIQSIQDACGIDISRPPDESERVRKASLHKLFRQIRVDSSGPAWLKKERLVFPQCKTWEMR